MGVYLSALQFNKILVMTHLIKESPVRTIGRWNNIIVVC